MRFLFLYIVLCVSCVQVAKTTEHEAAASNTEIAKTPESKVEISRVLCLTRKIHSGKYEAWEIWIARIGHNGEKLNATDITTVGADPTSMTAIYKSLDSGLEYLAINDLNIFRLIDSDGRIRAHIREEEFNAVEAEPQTLQIREGGSREVGVENFPTLTQCPPTN